MAAAAVFLFRIGVDTSIMIRREFGLYVALVALVFALCSCSHFGGHSARADAGSRVADKPVQAQPSVSDYKSALRELVSARIQSATKDAVEQRAVLIKRKPYFYKEYEVYPEGSDRFDVTIQERESRNIPLIADVAIDKQRFATRFHRKRQEAQNDMKFLRDTGTETITYELQGGRWVRVGSLFVASKSEEKVNGEWVPVKETQSRTVAGEQGEPKGWFGRTWSKIVGK